ncbi:2-hydroxyacyl-CoA dehydratase family protein [Deltaproteobacteria bacterium]|nr:2-hydroxyacyl-CoA dehydratase family protein [Deltaproteobacteria bacterium]
MIKLLEMCGFEADEMEEELPRIKKTFGKLGITAGDIERGKQRLTSYYDMELKGIRKILRLCFLELVGSVLAREEGKKKILFGFMAPGFELIGSVLVSKSRELFSAHQCWAALIVIGGIFDKLIPAFEAAESLWLKAGRVAHCGNVKSLVGLLALDIIPKPDLLVTTGFSCETSPKTIDMLHELYGIPICCYDTCQDKEIGNYYEASKRTIDLAAKSLRSLVRRVQEEVGFEITDDMLWDALEARSTFNDAMERLRKLMQNRDPMPMGATHDQLLIALNNLTLGIDMLPEAVRALNTLYEELEARVIGGMGVMQKGAPRVLALLPNHHSDPRLEHLADEMGIALIASDFGFMVPYEEIPDDPYQMMSLHLMSSLAASLPRRIPLIIEGCRRLNIDGVLDRYHVGCRSVAGDTMIIKDAVAKELGIPILLLEWENFDPRAYNHEQYKRRLEIFKMMLDSAGKNRAP